MNTKKKMTSVFIVLTLLIVACSAYAQHGPGMMWGYDDDYGRSDSMGPGMMGRGYGMGGPGMMGYGMMGPGMMGPGMMRGYGYGYRGGDMLDLNDSQEKKITGIQDALHKKQWDLMGALRDEYAKLRDLFYADKRDPAKITEQQAKIDKLRREMMANAIEAQNDIESVLTPDQKKRMRDYYGRGWMMR